jgi:2-methylcitrate dehydratase PrpD
MTTIADPLEQLGTFATGLTWDAIPEPAQRRAQLALRDTIGVLLGGATTLAGRIATAVAARSVGDAVVPGVAGVRTTTVLAAFAAAVHASALDFDDGHYRGGAIHPSSVIVPCLLVAAQPLDGVDRQRFTVAQVAGYEIGLRAAHLLWPRHDLDDYHCTGTAATLGAAAAVALLRGGDADVVARSIAIAWAHAPMATFQLPMVKESIGWSAATAVFAADLAAGGFMVMPPGVTSPLVRTFPPTPFHRPGALAEPFVASLGDVFETRMIYAKPYAACRYTHTALRSLAEMMSTAGLRAADIASIEVHTPQAAMHLSDAHPRTLEHAQYSFPFVLAAMATTGRAGADEISEAALADPQRLALAERVSVHHDPALDPAYPAHYGSRLVVIRRDGGRLEMQRLVAPGDPDEPMTDDEMREKFIRLAAATHGAGAAELADALAPRTAGDPQESAVQFARLLHRATGS